MQTSAALMHCNVPQAIANILHDEEFARPFAQICPDYANDYPGYYATSYGRIISARRKYPYALRPGKRGTATLQNATRGRSYEMMATTPIMRAFWPGVGLTRQRWETNKTPAHTSAYWLNIAPDWLQRRYQKRITRLQQTTYLHESAKTLSGLLSGGLTVRSWRLPLHLHVIAITLRIRITTTPEYRLGLQSWWGECGDVVMRQHYGVPMLYAAYRQLDHAFSQGETL